MQPNKDLNKIFRHHLIGDHFGNHIVGDVLCDPWYWGLPPGTNLENWGLLKGEEDRLNSLSDRVRPTNAYRGFRGSIAAIPGCIVVLGERPSFGKRYGKSVGKLFRELDLMSRWASELRDQFRQIGIELCVEGNQDVVFHVTDLVKFRGNGFNKPPLGASEIGISAACLHDELTLLKPVMVLITNMAADALQNDTVSSTMRSRDGIRKWVLSHPLAIEVPHWTSQSKDRVTWTSIVKGALDKRQSSSAGIGDFLRAAEETFGLGRFDYGLWRKEIQP
jgi:hypothetical protein